MITSKISTRDELSKLCESKRKTGKTIGFTSGAFDILHAGHVDYLEKAKAICDMLIVGVNTDESVRSYKGSRRPVIPEAQRIKVIAALEAVDYAFLFSERRNRANLEALKPHYYIKAGDYKPGSLTSADVMKEWGGEVRIIPFAEEVSTTGILSMLYRSAEEFVEEDGAVHIERLPRKQAPAVFIDRDGTINVEIHYLHDPDQFEFTPSAVEGIRKFQDMGYRIVIITNQPGIGFGYYSRQDFYRVNKRMLSLFSKHGILVEKIYFCPHTKAENCECRKPGQALIRRAQEELNLDIDQSIFIGDRTSDIEAGKRSGMRTVLVLTGAAGKDGDYAVEADYEAATLLEAANWILSQEQSEK